METIEQVACVLVGIFLIALCIGAYRKPSKEGDSFILVLLECLIEGLLVLLSPFKD